jgi:hypothetical protein
MFSQMNLTALGTGSYMGKTMIHWVAPEVLLGNRYIGT